MFRVEGKQAGVEFRKARAAIRTGAFGGKHARRIRSATDVHHAAAVLQGRVQRLTQLGLAGDADIERGNRQFDIVLDESVEPRPFRRGQQAAVDPQMGKALAARPFCQGRIQALARHDERRHESDVPAAILLEQACGDGVRRLRFDASFADRAVLHAQLHIEQAQEVVDLGERGHGALVSAAAGALLDGHGGRDAEDRVHIRPRCRLHELPGVGVERLQVASLTFRKQDVERQGALAAARNAGDHGELIEPEVHVEVLEIVLPRAANLDAALCRRRAAHREVGRRRPSPEPRPRPAADAAHRGGRGRYATPLCAQSRTASRRRQSRRRPRRPRVPNR